ncbi:MAG: hypothetical protein D6791_03030 [Chloroflexi bacterium]|nr:MAG: hypothetical protein D6791_03030 [Chloroflexota bacterium]
MLAFVLGGGGGRGALQVGALRALLEANIRPDLLVGTSAGAANAAFVAVRGFTSETLSELEAVWRDAAEADLLPANYLWLTVRMLFNRPQEHPRYRIRNFFVSHGLSPDLRFGDIQGPRLILVATDLNNGCPVLYGEDPEQSVLEGLLASTALPPWTYPLEVGDHLLMDGGVVSNLPIEPALSQGATEIIALDLAEPRAVAPSASGFGPFLTKLTITVEQRQIDLEMALAEARGVPVHRIALRADAPIPLWDFTHADTLITRGYEIAQREIATWQPDRRGTWREWLRRLRHRVPNRRSNAMQADA